MEYQLTLATLENRPVRYELWIYDDVIVNDGVVQLGAKTVKQKIIVSSNSSAEITQHISKEEWQAGKAVIVGIRDLQIGDVEEIFTKEYDENNVEQTVNTGNISLFLSKDKTIVFNADEYSGTVPNITVSQEVINSINNQNNGDLGLCFITDGVMKLWQ